ncbi:MAG: hypothetical protein ACQSGP_06235, partial [Frankia sp.]
RTVAGPGIRLLTGATATGLVAGAPPHSPTAATTVARIVGVHLTTRDGGADMIPADLVVDASGRGSRAPDWLAALGFEPRGRTASTSISGIRPGSTGAAPASSVASER